MRLITRLEQKATVEGLLDNFARSAISSQAERQEAGDYLFFGLDHRAGRGQLQILDNQPPKTTNSNGSATALKRQWSGLTATKIERRRRVCTYRLLNDLFARLGYCMLTQPCHRLVGLKMGANNLKRETIRSFSRS
ncbi:MAG: hypothetical protein ACYCVD_17035 [Desulfitobacteriaceae bacterium]